MSEIGNDRMDLGFLPVGMARSYVGHERKAPSHLAQRHPHLLKTLGDAWGKPEEFEAAMEGLLISKRPNRQGFEPEVMEELFFMKSLHEIAFPTDPGTSWGRVAEAFASTPEPISEESLGGGIEEASAEEALAELELEKPESPLERRQRAAVLRAQQALGANAWGMLTTIMAAREELVRRAAGKTARPCSDLLGEILVSRGAIEREDLEAALSEQEAAARAGKPRELLGQILVRLGSCQKEDAIKARSVQEGIALIDLGEISADYEALRLIPKESQKSLRALPILEARGWLGVAVENPLEFDKKDYLEFLSHKKIEIFWAKGEQIAERLERPFGREEAARAAQDFEREAKKAAKPLEERRNGERATQASSQSARDENDPTVVRLVEMFLREAHARKASDIHIEVAPEPDKSQIRFRVDGDLALYAKFERVAHDATISRLKIMAGLDIAERRRPQDGKFRAEGDGGAAFEARLATLPGSEGKEMAVIRILAAKDALPLEKLGLSAGAFAGFAKACDSPHGIVLVCGLTGSGKTTTLHAALKRLNEPSAKIWTVEDPVEITQHGLCQTQVNAKAGYTFGAALRAFLRADPDVIMVGEIRDQETAAAALEAALTGHLVLSTLHTNSAAETATRLVDLDADPFALGDALRGILAQRLARKLCACASARKPTPEEMDSIAAEALAAMGEPRAGKQRRDELLSSWIAGRPGAEPSLREAKGCERCRGSGHSGRAGVYEFLEASAEIGHMLAGGASAEALRAKAVAQGMVPLKAAALEMALFGIISLREARAVAM